MASDKSQTTKRLKRKPRTEIEELLIKFEHDENSLTREHEQRLAQAGFIERRIVFKLTDVGYEALEAAHAKR